MGTLNVKINDELHKRFTNTLFERKGMKKGNITEAIEEAITLWLEKKT